MRKDRFQSKDDYLRIKGIRDDLVYRGPRSISLDITTICNLKCLYCWFHSPLAKPPSPSHLPLSAIKKIIDEASSLGVKEIEITADGEPLLHPKIKSIIQYILHKKIGFSLTTNASIDLTKAGFIQYLLKANLLEINLAATNALDYLSFQAPNLKKSFAFATVIKNMRALVKKRANNPFPIITINYVLFRKNYKNLYKIIKLAEVLGINYIDFIPIDTTKETEALQLNKRDLMELAKIIRPLLEKRLRIKSNLANLYTAFTDYKNSIYYSRGCYIGWFNLFIDYKGNVGVCCEKEDFLFGNIYKKSLSRIWKDKEFHEKMRLYCKYKFDLKKKFWKQCRFCGEGEFNKKIESLI
ncbi:MAG: radical SAM protein [Candidatus Omnitrophica bacterium]|nr:radical SAM protein [Candidatus Omnitrophota bacterium]